MTCKSTKTKPTTTTSTKSATSMSITKTSTTVAITTMIATLNTKFSQANYNYITINKPLHPEWSTITTTAEQYQM
jgi:hypothetical protein